MEEIVIDLPGVIHASWEDGESFPVRDGAPTKGNDALMFAVRTASRLFSAHAEVAVLDDMQGRLTTMLGNRP